MCAWPSRTLTRPGNRYCTVRRSRAHTRARRYRRISAVTIADAVEAELPNREQSSGHHAADPFCLFDTIDAAEIVDACVSRNAQHNSPLMMMIILLFFFLLFSASHICLSSPSLSSFPNKHEGHTHISRSLVKSPKQTAVARVREMAAQVPLWQQIVTNAEDGGLKSIFDLATVHADIFQVITGGEGIKTLREFVSSWEGRNYEKRLTRWIDRNVPSCKGRRVEGSRLKLAWKAGFDRTQNDDNLTKNGGSSATKMEDLEDELPSGEKEKMEEEFNNMYHVVVDNPVFPCDPLTNRTWREFRRWQMSVTTTSQMKSLLYDQAPKTSERTQLGEHTSVVNEIAERLRAETCGGILFRPVHLDERVGQMWQLLGGLQDQAKHSRPHDAVGHSAQLRRSWFEDCHEQWNRSQ